MKTVGFKHFFVTADDQLFALSQTHYNQLLSPKPQLSVSVFAGQRIRSARLVLAMQDAKPNGVILATYSYVTFNLDGTANFDAYARDERDYIGSIDMNGARYRQQQKVIDITQRLARRRVRWQPSVALEKKIWSCALGKTQCLPLEIDKTLQSL